MNIIDVTAENVEKTGFFCKMSRKKSAWDKVKVFKGLSPAELAPVPPLVAEPRTGLSMGESMEITAQKWDIPREHQDQLALASHMKAAAAYDAGFYDDLVIPFQDAEEDNNIRRDTSFEKLQTLNPVFDRKSGEGTMTAGNSTPLTDGAAAVLLASEDWARAHDLPVQAYLTATRTAAVDFVQDEGLLMAPTVAVAEMLQQTGLTLQDFDFYEVHEAFAAQVLCTLAAWESEDYCRDRLGLDAPLGAFACLGNHEHSRGLSAALAARTELPGPPARNVFGRPVQEESAAGAGERTSVATGMAMAGLRAAAFLAPALVTLASPPPARPRSGCRARREARPAAARSAAMRSGSGGCDRNRRFRPLLSQNSSLPSEA